MAREMKVLTVVGARPQFIKAAMVARAIGVWNGRPGVVSPIHEVLVHTGQHYDTGMSEIFFRELHLPTPQYNLEIGSGLHGQQTGRMLEALETAMVKERPDIVLVYGDTNSTLAGALAASKLHIPVAHVEAGLRSFNRFMPEETNRVLCDHAATWLFCPTECAVFNLEKEGLVKGVYLVGDVMVDAVRRYLPIARRHSTILGDLDITPRCYYLATVHRAENTDDGQQLSEILSALGNLNVPVVLPCHPRTKKRMLELGLAKLIEGTSLRVIDPVGYLDMLVLEADAGIIFTDSGGVQKEAYWLGVPCVTLREETEWVETLQSGWNVLVGSCRETLVQSVQRFREHKTFNSKPNNLGSGEAARLIVEHLMTAFDRPPIESEFCKRKDRAQRNYLGSV